MFLSGQHDHTSLRSGESLLYKRAGILVWFGNKGIPLSHGC